MKIKFHSITMWIVVHGLLLFLIRPISTLIQHGSNITGSFNVNLYVFCLVFTTICIGTFFYFFSLIKLPPDPFKGVQTRIKTYRYLGTFIIWLLIWFLLARDRMAGGFEELLLASSSDYIHGNSTFLLNTVTTLITFFVINSYYLNCNLVTSTAIRFILILFGLLTGIVTGSKTLALYPIFILILIYSCKNRGVPASWIAILSLVIAPIITLLNEIRHYGLGGLDSVASEKAPLGSVFFNAFIERYYGTDIVYAIIRGHIDQGKSYYWGESLMSFFYGLIPRAFWENKPIISFGKIVSEEYLPPVFSGTGISAAPTVFGELFANFSFGSLLLIPFAALALKYHLRVVHLKIQNGSNHYLTYYLISFTTIAFFLEASIVGWVMQLIILYISTYFMSKGCGKS